MAKTKTSSAVKARYNKKAYDSISLRVYKGVKEKIKAAADAAGMSVNGFIIGAIEKQMGGSHDETEPRAQPEAPEK